MLSIVIWVKFVREWEKVVDLVIDVFFVLWFLLVLFLMLKFLLLLWFVIDIWLDRLWGVCMFILELLLNLLLGVCGSNLLLDIYESLYCILIFNCFYCYYKYCFYLWIISGKKKFLGIIFLFVFVEMEFYFLVIFIVN